MPGLTQCTHSHCAVHSFFSLATTLRCVRCTAIRYGVRLCAPRSSARAAASTASGTSALLGQDGARQAMFSRAELLMTGPVNVSYL